MTDDRDPNPTEPRPADFDSPWKEAIDAFFRPFMALFFPAVHDRIDWTRPYEFLDAELQRITGDSEIGRRYADRLVKVYSREGTELWLLLHIEVQAQADARFPERMFQYYYRIYDRFGAVEIVSLALLTNDLTGPDSGVYRREHDGFGVRLRFRVQALPDWDEDELIRRAEINPFAVVALAQLAAHRRVGDPERKVRKGEIIALLYRYRYARDDVLMLLRFIDWLIRLPRALERALRQELADLEEQTKMSYVTSWEQFAREEGREEGEQRGEAKALLRLLQVKFGPMTPDIESRVKTAEPAQLDVWLTRILTAATPEDLFR
jgi:hypothetical protein